MKTDNLDKNEEAEINKTVTAHGVRNGSKTGLLLGEPDGKFGIIVTDGSADFLWEKSRWKPTGHTLEVDSEYFSDLLLIIMSKGSATAVDEKKIRKDYNIPDIHFRLTS